MKKFAVQVIFILFIPLAVFAGGQSEAVPAASAVDGTVEYVEGDVTINGNTAEFGMKVPYGALVKTGTESYCEIVFDSKNIFRIMESTAATISLSAAAPEIMIEKGAFAALFTKLEAFTSDEPFKVRTGTTLAGVRGTAFFVKVEDPDTTYVCICNGELELSEPDGANAGTVSSGHHKASRYKNIGGRIEVSKAPLLYHTDEDMEALASGIDEEILWTDSYKTEY